MILQTSHKSLCAGFNEADPDAIIAWNKRMADLVTMDGIAKAIRDRVPAGSIRKLQSLTKIQKEWLRKRLRKADFGEKMRLHYYLGVILEDENEVQECFRIIQSEVLEATIKSLAYNEQARIVTDSCISQMRRYRSNLQALFLVHPAAFIQVAVDQKQEYNC